MCSWVLEMCRVHLRNQVLNLILIKLNLNSHTRLPATRVDITVEDETPSGESYSAVSAADGGLLCHGCAPSGWKLSRFLGAWSVVDTFCTVVCFDL